MSYTDTPELKKLLVDARKAGEITLTDKEATMRDSNNKEDAPDDKGWWRFAGGKFVDPKTTAAGALAYALLAAGATRKEAVNYGAAPDAEVKFARSGGRAGRAFANFNDLVRAAGRHQKANKLPIPGKPRPKSVLDTPAPAAEAPAKAPAAPKGSRPAKRAAKVA